MRRILLLIAVAVVLGTFAAPVTASPDPCVINCFSATSATTTDAE